MAGESNSQTLSSATNNQSDNNIVNSNNNNSSASGLTADLITHQQQQSEMIEDEDPLLISQSLTYVTDDGGTLHSFQSAPFSAGTILFVQLKVMSLSLNYDRCISTCSDS